MVFVNNNRLFNILSINNIATFACGFLKYWRDPCLRDYVCLFKVSM